MKGALSGAQFYEFLPAPLFWYCLFVLLGWHAMDSGPSRRRARGRRRSRFLRSRLSTILPSPRGDIFAWLSSIVGSVQAPLSPALASFMYASAGLEQHYVFCLAFATIAIVATYMLVAEISEPYADIMAALSIAVLTAVTWYTLRGSEFSDTLLGGGTAFTPCSSAAPFFTVATLRRASRAQPRVSTGRRMDHVERSTGHAMEAS